MNLLPPPSAELVLIAAAVEALLIDLSPKQRLRFLKRMSENIETLADIGKVRRIREPCEDEATRAAVAQAAEWYRRSMPRLIDKF